MKQDEKEHVKNQLENYLRNKGIDTSKNFPCLICGKGHKTPNMSYKNNRIHCFACGIDMDIIDLIGHETGKSGAALFNYCYDYFNVHIESKSERRLEDIFSSTEELPVKFDGPGPSKKDKKEEVIDYSDYFLKAKQDLQASAEALEYLQKRGISTGTAVRFGVGYDKEWRSPKAIRDGKNPPATARIIIPTSSHSYLARATSEKVDNRYKKMKEGSVEIFNKGALSQREKPVFIVEGEIDALSIIEIDGEALALGSANNIDKLVELCKPDPPTVPLILSLDNDEAGRAMQAKLKEKLWECKACFCEMNISGKYKDQNEYLMKDRSGFKAIMQESLKNARQACENENKIKETDATERYLETAAAYYINAFIGDIAANADTPAIPTGFDELDAALDGGLYEGLYIIGAISSIGKTTFILQVADQIAQRGRDVLIFSLEMSLYELMAKSISRLTLENCGGITRNAKTTRGILAGAKRKYYSAEEKALINQSIADYAEYSQYIYIHEGVGTIGVEEIKQSVHNHILFTGRVPVVIIDYLQIIAPYEIRATDKQNTDKAVLELKRLSRDKKIPVIAISSFNRDNYTAPVNLASFKESGAIEYSSDVLLGLQLKGMDELSHDSKRADTIRQIEEWKNADPRKAQLKILKNRNGKTGISLYYDYYPMFNTFKERAGQIEKKVERRR